MMYEKKGVYKSLIKGATFGLIFLVTTPVVAPKSNENLVKKLNHTPIVHFLPFKTDSSGSYYRTNQKPEIGLDSSLYSKRLSKALHIVTFINPPKQQKNNAKEDYP